MENKGKTIALFFFIITFTILMLFASISIIDKKNFEVRLLKSATVSFNVVLSLILVGQYLLVVKRLNTSTGRALLITSLAFLFNGIFRFEPVFQLTKDLIGSIALSTIVQDIPLSVALVTLIYIANK